LNEILGQENKIQSDVMGSNPQALSDGPEPLQLSIIRPEELGACPFWIGLYAKGSASPRDLFSIPTAEGIFSLVSDVGLSEDKPLMLSHSHPEQPPRQFYLIPESQCRQSLDAVRDRLVTTVESLNPLQVGIYFAPDRLSIPIAAHLLEEVSLGIAFLRTKELYFYTGKLGVNSLLNAALRIKSRLAGHREIFVYH
jgi:hypothetical protein